LKSQNLCCCCLSLLQSAKLLLGQGTTKEIRNKKEDSERVPLALEEEKAFLVPGLAGKLESCNWEGKKQHTL